jgi:DNA repair protein REV1
MDCFFAAVAERNHPEILGKPVVIAHSVHSSEVSTSNYAARKHGISHGMTVRKARELCPNLVIMPYEFEEYETVSFEVYETLFSFQRAVCPVSCDEAFLEVSEDDLVHSETDDVMPMLVDYASQIRKAIFKRTQCTASAGIGPSMLIARIATQNAKPDGVCCYSFEDVRIIHSIPRDIGQCQM